MKKIISTLFFALFFLLGYGQNDDYCVVNFEDNYNCNTDYLWRDTISDTNNIWQLGAPQKTTFITANSSPNVIVTDTIDPYPVNDTSSFILVHIVDNEGFLCPMFAGIRGNYFVNSDSLTDFGVIEFSPDNGSLWIDLFKDTVYDQYIDWLSQKPIFTGNNFYWQEFGVNLAELGPLLNIQLNDTVLFRFTFISDSVQTFKDGLMFDNLVLEDHCGGITESDLSFFASTFFPNPTINSATIEFKNTSNSSFTLRVFDITGRVFVEKANIRSNRIELNTENLPPGIYQYQLLSEKEQKQSMGKFVVN